MFYSNNKKLLFQVYLIEACYLFEKKQENNDIIKEDESKMLLNKNDEILKQELEDKIEQLNVEKPKIINNDSVREKVIQENEMNNEDSLLVVLKNSKAIYRKKAQSEFNKLENYIAQKNKFGIAKFFSLAKVVASSETGCLLILEENDYDMFCKKFHVFKKILKKINYNSVYILTKKEWEEQRPIFLKQVEEKENNLEKKLMDYFPNVYIINE